jgi:hypothetical protein
MNAGPLIVACALVLSACGNAGPSSSNRIATAVTASASAAPVAASTDASAIVPADAAQLARYDGYGDMRLGMDETAFGAAWNGKLVDTRPQPGSSCFYKRPLWVKLPGDFAFMFEGGRFVRYDVGTTKEIAPGGGRVGMTEAQIHTLYGSQVEEQLHKYVAGARYLRVKAPQGNGVLLFETGADGKVTRWRVGVPPQVDNVEGCG